MKTHLTSIALSLLITVIAAENDRCSEEKLNFPGLRKERKDSYEDNHLFQIACESGYKINEEAEVRCSKGEWKANVTPCAPANCAEPPTIPYAQIEKTSTTHGSYVTYAFQDPYKLLGYPRAQCLYGEWISKPILNNGDITTPVIQGDITTPVTQGDITTPVTQGITCPWIITNNRLVVAYTNINKLNSTATFRCPPNIKLIGENSTICMPNGEWSKSRPTCESQFDSDFTLQNVWGRLQSDSRSIIQCLGDDSYKKIKFSRKLDTGQGSRLPKNSQQFMQAKPVYARILFMPGDDKLNRFGAFQCKIVKGDVSTEILTLKLPPSTLAELDAVNPYLRTQVGSTLVLEVTAAKKLDLPVKWRHNGVDVPAWEDQLRVEIPDVKQSDAGVYESFYEGRRKEGVHALMRVIVKKCSNDTYGDSCDQGCPSCYNGGICHDIYGECVCPAGFTGANCEIACGGNYFGADCSKFCSPPQNKNNTDELCASHLFCKPDPYGCSCAPGFKGSSCMEHCEPGWYGADCDQPCHCAFGSADCNRITGACSTGGCAKGWRGNSCQIEDPNAVNEETTTQAYCPAGWFGASCEKRCRCVEKDAGCDAVSGFCRNGCEEGFGGPSCSDHVSCNKFEISENLNVVYSNDVKVESIATFSCVSPYTLVGNHAARCLQNGTWNSTLPSCEASMCSTESLLLSLLEKVLLDLKNVTDKYVPYGTELQFLCGPNSFLSGSQKTKCGRQGIWEYGAVRCIHVCVLGEITPQLLVEPSKEFYSFGETVTFSCPFGQKLSSEIRRVMCLGTSWSDPIPGCVEVAYR